MKLRAKFSVLAAVLCIALSLEAAPIDLSNDYASPLGRESLSVTTNDVVLIETPSNGTAVLQFTAFGSSTASYRWRYRSSPTGDVIDGTGQVMESYDRKAMPDGSYRVTARPDHNTAVRIGGMSMQWSLGGKSHGWLYYHPARAKIQVLRSDAFDKHF